MTGDRVMRVASAMRRELASAFLYESKNPFFQGLVVTKVEVSKDLRIATVFYTARITGEALPGGMETHLRKASHHWGKLLRDRLGLKYLPELRFRYDTSVEKMERIEELLRQIKEGEGEEEGDK